MGSPRRKRRVTGEAAEIIRRYPVRSELQAYLHNSDWADVDAIIAEALGNAPPLFLYVDAIDDNFKWSPAHWMRCQRGLYYAVMDLLRATDGLARLHVVIALRDIALASTRSSEHGPRYLENTHINMLTWTEDSIRQFLAQKIRRLPDFYFTDPKTKSVASWLGISKIAPDRRGADPEPIDQYLIRHTRLVPRDIVVQGNRLCRYVYDCRSTGRTPQAEELRREIASASREFASSQLAQCANQVISDAIPEGAADAHYSHVYTQPNEYQMTDAVERICTAIRHVGKEAFSRNDLLDMEDRAGDAFGQGVNLADILWQNSLVGLLEQGKNGSTYFSLTDMASTNLPTSARYVFNPILFDRVAELKPTLKAAQYPRG